MALTYRCNVTICPSVAPRLPKCEPDEVADPSLLDLTAHTSQSGVTYELVRCAHECSAGVYLE
jgi:hypothetical protein